MTAQEANADHRRRILSVIVIALWLIPSAVAFTVIPPDSIDIEQWLIRQFGSGRAGDAFDGVNRLFYPLFCGAVVTWIAVCAELWIYRIRDATMVGIATPVIAILISFIGDNDLNDPNWHAIMALATIGCFVGIVTAVGVCLYQSTTQKQRLDTT